PHTRGRSGSPPAAQGRMRRSSRRRGCERSFPGRKGERRRAGASHVERRSEDPLQGSGAQVLALLPRHRGQAPPQTTATQPRTRGEAGGSTKRPVERGGVCWQRNGRGGGQGAERGRGGAP